MFRFLRLDLFCDSVAIALVNLFFPPVLFLVVLRCSLVSQMFRFLRLDLFCASVAIAIVNICLPPVLLFVAFRCSLVS